MTVVFSPPLLRLTVNKGVGLGKVVHSPPPSRGVTPNDHDHSRGPLETKPDGTSQNEYTNPLLRVEGVPE